MSKSSLHEHAHNLQSEHAMVEDTITDGKRIAQLLASELTGLEMEPLNKVTVVDANADASPSETGTIAYSLSYRDEMVATVSIYPTYANVTFTINTPWPDHMSQPSVVHESNDRIVRLTSGAAVKRGVDAIAAVLSHR